MIKNVYDPIDEVFRYIHDSRRTLKTDLENHLQSVFSQDTISLDPIISELNEAGLIFAEPHYLSIKPKGDNVAVKHGLYSIWLQTHDDERKLSKKLVIEQIKEFEKDNWYKKREFIVAVAAFALALLTLIFQLCKIL